MWHKDKSSIHSIQAYSREGFYNPSRNGYNETELNTFGTHIYEPIFDIWIYENEWSNGVCSCTNISTCCCAFFCLPCFICKLFKRTGEFSLTPLFAPNALMALRTKVRTGFRIRGSLLDDFFKTTLLPCCISIQIEKELNTQGL